MHTEALFIYMLPQSKRFAFSEYVWFIVLLHSSALMNVNIHNTIAGNSKYVWASLHVLIKDFFHKKSLMSKCYSMLDKELVLDQVSGTGPCWEV